MLIFCDFIQVYVFTTNQHLKELHNCDHSGVAGEISTLNKVFLCYFCNIVLKLGNGFSFLSFQLD